MREVNCTALLEERHGFSWDEFETWNGREELAFALLVPLVIYFLVPLFVMRWRKKVFPAALKPFNLVALQTLGFICLLVFTLVRDYVSPEKFPCDLFLWSRLFFAPLVFAPEVLMTYFLIQRVELSRAMEACKVSEEDLRLDEVVDCVKRSGWKRMLKVMSFILMIPLALCLAAYRQPFYGNECKGCYRESVGIIVILVGYLAATGIGAILLRQLRDYEDPLFLRREREKALMAIFFGGLLTTIIALLNLEIEKEGIFNSLWTFILVSMYLSFINCLRPTWRSFYSRNRSIRIRKRKREKRRAARRKKLKGVGTTSSTSTSEAEVESMTLQDILNFSEGLAAFQKFCVNQLAVENVLFYKSATEWAKLFDEVSESVCEVVAGNIFHAFIPNGAPMQINLKSATQTELIRVFEEGIRKDMDIFEKAVSEIFNLMQTDVFQRFLESNLYQELTKRTSLVQNSPPRTTVAAV